MRAIREEGCYSQIAKETLHFQRLTNGGLDTAYNTSVTALTASNLNDNLVPCLNFVNDRYARSSGEKGTSGSAALRSSGNSRCSLHEVAPWIKTLIPHNIRSTHHFLFLKKLFEFIL